MSNVDGLTEGCWSVMAGFASERIRMRAGEGDVGGTIGRCEDGDGKEMIEHLVLYPNLWCVVTGPIALPSKVSRSGNSLLWSADGNGFLFQPGLC
jgi:hypothetical protein